jgi:hypothetical protein
LSEEVPVGGGEALTLVIYLIMCGGGAFVLWKFYRALARIGEELGEIRMILRNGPVPPSE